MDNSEIKPMKKIAIFASGSGTNAENLIKYFNASEREGHVALVLTNRPDAHVIQRAKNLDVPVAVLSRAEINNPELILPLLQDYSVDIIVLAGFLLMIPDFLLQAYKDRIVNIHPSLLPKFGGKGMYGRHVHEAVVAAGETETGITVHLVTDRCDEGRILYQTSVQVMPSDTPEDVEAKVHALEYVHFPIAVSNLLKSL